MRERGSGTTAGNRIEVGVAVGSIPASAKW